MVHRCSVALLLLLGACGAVSETGDAGRGADARRDVVQRADVAAESDAPDASVRDSRADAPVATCASVAAQICRQAFQCPQAGGVCTESPTVTQLCFPTVADCEALFANCQPPVSGQWTLIPDPAACAAALPSIACTKLGEDNQFVLPSSCVNCPAGMRCDAPADVDATLATGDSG